MDPKVIPALPEWGIKYSDTLIIAGPCSAESEEQVMATARGLASCGISAFRAGIWKPRTRPNCFEGVGAAGLKWVKQAGEFLGVPVAVEVANPQHVEDCLKANIDILWVGARTTVNPFAVQALADALRGVDVPVLVKNPVNPELDLWIGAMERLHTVGVKRLGAIHRGFSTVDNAIYRNKPKWEIAIELRRRYPTLPLICDPSHICGSTALIHSVAQKAMDLNFDGLMIESHIDPKSALSDAKQQLTPEDLGRLIKSLIYKKPYSEDMDLRHELERLRAAIDAVDHQLIDLFARRMDIARRIGEVKERGGITIYQPSRWDEIVHSRITMGHAYSLSEEFIFNVFENIHQEAIAAQSRREKEDTV